MGFAKFMATTTGRAIRIIAGLVMIVMGLFVMQDSTGVLIAIVGIAPLAAGIFNVCLVAPFIGAPFSGRRALGR